MRRDFKSLGLVALRKESVDRNRYLGIEADPFDWVALRKESVDRNFAHLTVGPGFQVALRKESVDRNRQAIVHCKEEVCRSPQGERG